MFTRALLVLLPLLSAQAKIYDRCKLALELVDVHKISTGDLSTWLCILYHESRFDTKAHNANSGEHGIFQISDMYWCSPSGTLCGMTCNDLKNDDIRDDVNCARIIFEEYQRISGDGFTGWKVYPQHCKDKNYVATFIKGCDLYRVESGNVNTTNKIYTMSSRTLRILELVTAKTISNSQSNVEEQQNNPAIHTEDLPIILEGEQQTNPAIQLIDIPIIFEDEILIPEANENISNFNVVENTFQSNENLNINILQASKTVNLNQYSTTEIPSTSGMLTAVMIPKNNLYKCRLG
ncbi:hypothetical protein FQR65_LT13597 [Abscondita terminalis]|nr:hypothetical protein FQR65_LT13597 [Abscondita terminalis]